MIKRLIFALLFAAIFVSLCAAQSQLRNFHQEGPASQDIQTDQYTASHPSLPLGTQVQVINPRNNKQVTATITGRIAATEGRIVDLSQGAAKALGFPARGRAPVILQVVDSRRPRPAPTPEPPPPETESEPEAPAEDLPPEEPSQEEEPPEETPPVDPEPQPEPEPESEPQLDSEPPVEQPLIVEPSYPPDSGAPSPAVDNSDSKTQTTAPVSAQSPNITIYNTIMSPGSFATDSAPVIANSGGDPNPITATAPSSAVGSEKGPARSAPIIATAPQSMVSTVEQLPPPPPQVEPEPPSVPAPVDPPSPPPEPKKEASNPAVATATAQIIAVPTPQQPRQIVIQPPVQPAPPSRPAPQPSPQPPTASPLPPLRDVGPALIKPYMPNPNSGKIYRVQVGSYKNTWHAKEAYDRLTTVGFKPAYERYEDYIRVVIPGIRTQDMPAVAVLVGRVGFREALIREEN
ncbi:MAG: SPOR domain-containing protein [Treponema sp.]|nr:SPOR domain-containing protein [Treponema sp.]